MPRSEPPARLAPWLMAGLSLLLAVSSVRGDVAPAFLLEWGSFGPGIGQF